MYPPSALSLPEMPRHYRPGLDVVRLTALLPVLCYHYCIEAARLGFAVPTALISRGMADWVELGLAWFFLLSGAALCLQWQGRFSLRRYLAGRAAATYPAFWLGFAALFLYGEVLHGNNADIPRWRVIFSLLGLDGYLTPVTVTFYKIGEWFLGVILILYLVFPLLASLCAKWPLPTLAALGLVQLGYTCWLLPQYGSGDYSARFNQLPAFSGVLAVGLAAAWVFAKFAHGGWAQHVLPRAGCTVLGLAALIWLDAEMRAQAAAAEYQQFQLINRMPLVLAAAAVLVCFGLGLTLPEVLRRALRWLAALTYSFYLWHQMLTVFLKYDLHLSLIHI